MGKVGKIASLTSVEFVCLVESSPTLAEILRKIGLRAVGGNYKTIKKRIIQEGLDLDAILQRSKKQIRKTLDESRGREVLRDDEIFCYRDITSNTTIKRRILNKNLVPYLCSECGTGCLWNGKILTLHLDHIDGDAKNNNIENLRFLCPNCHSQTTTYCSRNK